MNSTRTGDQPIEINFSSVTRQPVIVKKRRKMKDNQFTFNWTTTFIIGKGEKVDGGSRTLGPCVFIASNAEWL